MPGSVPSSFPAGDCHLKYNLWAYKDFFLNHLLSDCLWGRGFTSGAVNLGISFSREAATTVLLNGVVCLPNCLLNTYIFAYRGQLWSELAAEIHTARKGAEKI